jgi:hypothetical protein
MNKEEAKVILDPEDLILWIKGKIAKRTEFKGHDSVFKKVHESLKGGKFESKYMYGLDVRRALSKLQETLLDGNEDGR